MMFEPPSADLSTQFLSTVTNQLYIWDVLKETEPVRRWQAQGQPLINCARWSPHAPQTLIVTGGNDRSLSIMDCRSGDVVWYTENAHWRPVRDAQFSTFIPFWLASTGEDCFVNIWDIRFMHHAPVAKIDGHDGVINKVSSDQLTHLA
ncbi:WD40-repeat-containing domain protein [Radiomyces spectabilis]|uniref:WD40-repeat-containing domain protein n=1 Tax=Radiomyces spectabilis TaxID=64574 RepID=UPI002220C889|nr:WD40-repeat-containing domain protein [Radiomyces spectabilis]KAI8384425.1 WD40-repeat-containing domain protein [Radiomyces spectabilis]